MQPQDSMEDQEDFDIQEHFDVQQYDKDDGEEIKFTFRQEDFDQGLIANPDLVGKEYKMCNNYPMALRLARFVPKENRFIYTVRKATVQPWTTSKKGDGSVNKILYCPKAKEETHKFTPAGSDKEYQLRVTDMIGPKSNATMTDNIHSYPEDIISLTECSAEKLDKMGFSKIEWREYYDSGILEGLKFHRKDKEESDPYGELFRCEVQFEYELKMEDTAKIAVTHDDRFVTAISFLDCKGDQIGKMLGKPKAQGASGQQREELIGLLPGEKLVGMKVQDAKDPNDEGAIMIGRVGFMLSAPSQKAGIHWSYSGSSVNYDTHTRYAKQMGSLLSVKEAEALIEEHGVMFPGEDQWAAVEDEDWIQLGDSCHAPGKLHSEFGPPDWRNKTNDFVWRHVFLWKDAETSCAESGSIQIDENFSEKTVEKMSLEKEKPKNLFLSTIKVIKYEAEQKPVLVKEILCENNLQPATDYGPSVAYFQDCIYFFKRIIKSETGTYHQLYKYNFDLNQEFAVDGCKLSEEEGFETKIQFFEQPKSENFATEQEFVKNTYVSQASTITKPWDAARNAFKIFCIGNQKLVYDSNELKFQYFSKLALLKNEQELKFTIFTTKHRFKFTVPVQDTPVVEKASDFETTIKQRKNSNDYHQDWPFELKKANIKMNNQDISIDYFLVIHGNSNINVELLEMFTEEQENEVSRKIKQKISGGLYHKGSFTQETTILDRFDDNIQGVTFPAIMPRNIVGSIFEGKQDMDQHRKVYESLDNKSIILYVFAGREILIATLKPTSKFKKVQDAYAATGFDAVPDSQKLKMMQVEINTLKQMVQEQKKMIDQLLTPK